MCRLEWFRVQFDVTSTRRICSIQIVSHDRGFALTCYPRKRYRMMFCFALVVSFRRFLVCFRGFLIGFRFFPTTWQDHCRHGEEKKWGDKAERRLAQFRSHTKRSIHLCAGLGGWRSTFTESHRENTKEYRGQPGMHCPTVLQPIDSKVSRAYGWRNN